MNSNFSNSRQSRQLLRTPGQGRRVRHSVYNNVITNVGQQALQMGRATGDRTSPKATCAGLGMLRQRRDGKQIIGGLYPIAYVNANNVHFEYTRSWARATPCCEFSAKANVATTPRPTAFTATTWCNTATWGKPGITVPTSTPARSKFDAITGYRQLTHPPAFRRCPARRPTCRRRQSPTGRRLRPANTPPLQAYAPTPRAKRRPGCRRSADFNGHGTWPKLRALCATPPSPPSPMV